MKAEFMLDPVTGAVLHELNADDRLHPASLTKMMTIYIAFEAARNGEFGYDAETTVSAKAAAETGSRLGLRVGQRIRMRELVTATAVLSANDAATALAEAIGGTEAAFVTRMNETAQRLGMTRTSFRNAHGLTAEGHLSTARDMSRLGLALLRDHPQFFGLFRQVRARAGGREIGHTNRLYLQSVEGADGIKTGYTRAAGFNLTASARRGDKRLIVTVMGARGSAERSARVAALMDAGFGKAVRAPEILLAARGLPADLSAEPTPAPDIQETGAHREGPPGPILASLQGHPGSGSGDVVHDRHGAGSIFAALVVERTSTIGGAPHWQDEAHGEGLGMEGVSGMDGPPDLVMRPPARHVEARAFTATTQGLGTEDEFAATAPLDTSAGMGVGLGSVGLGFFGQ